MIQQRSQGDKFLLFSPVVTRQLAKRIFSVAYFTFLSHLLILSLFFLLQFIWLCIGNSICLSSCLCLASKVNEATKSKLCSIEANAIFNSITGSGRSEALSLMKAQYTQLIERTEALILGLWLLKVTISVVTCPDNVHRLSYPTVFRLCII